MLQQLRPQHTELTAIYAQGKAVAGGMFDKRMLEPLTKSFNCFDRFKACRMKGFVESILESDACQRPRPSRKVEGDHRGFKSQLPQDGGIDFIAKDS